MKKPKISIIVCCYGGELTIENTLQSLLCQNIPNEDYEVVIVDDGSKDRSAKIIKDFIKKNTNNNETNFNYFRKKNEGLSIARNFGISKSRADLVSFIDEDAIARKDFLKNVIKYFNENDSVNCLGGEIEIYDNQNEFANLFHNSFFAVYMSDPKSIIGTNMSFRKSFLKQAGGFQPEFSYRGDESVLFEKSKDIIVKGRSNDVVIKHFQPDNQNKWIKTRFENGYFSAAIDLFMRKEKKYLYKEIFKKTVLISAPLFIIFSLLFFIYSSFFSIVTLLIILIIFLKKFILNKLIYKNLLFFINNRNGKFNLLEIIQIVYLTIYGTYKQDLGYIKGYFNFCNTVWVRSKQL
jgi:glycosyltransferase involved in cell wall biosynthesis